MRTTPCNAAHGPIAIRSKRGPDLTALGKGRVSARLGWEGEKGRSRRWLVALALALSGCVPTAEFTDLREDVRELQSDNKKLKQTEGDLRKRLEAADRNQLPTTTLKRLDALEAALTDLKTRQQAIDQKLAAVITQLEESARPMESLSGRSEDPGTKPPPKPPPLPPVTGKSSPPAVFENQAVLTPTASFNLAYNDYLKGNYDLAVAGFESFLRQFPSTSLAAHAQYWIGESYANKREYRSAVDAYEHVVTSYPKSDKVPAALYKAGSGYAELGDLAKARSLFKRVIEEYSQSDEAARAKQRLAELR
jgi:tol-pal system protein YbgF